MRQINETLQSFPTKSAISVIDRQLRQAGMPAMSVERGREVGGNLSEDIVLIKFSEGSLDIKKILKIIALVGWEYSGWWYEQGELQSRLIKNVDDFPEGVDERTIVTITIEDRHARTPEEPQNTYYHCTTMDAVEKISRVGLQPRSKSKMFEYPERTFLAMSLRAALAIKPMLSNVSGKRYAVLKVSNGNRLKTYCDPRYSGGVYTYDYVPPKDLTYWDTAKNAFVPFDVFSTDGALPKKQAPHNYHHMKQSVLAERVVESYQEFVRQTIAGQ